MIVVLVMINGDDDFGENDLFMIINSWWCIYAYVWFGDVYICI